MAISVARLTVASSTPGVLPRKRSIRFTHEAQVMPSIGSWISVAARAGPVVRHTPREYSRRVPPASAGDPARLATLARMPPTEIAILTLPGPLGPYVVAATERGVVAAGWATTDDAILDDVRRRSGPSSWSATVRRPTSWPPPARAAEAPRRRRRSRPGPSRSTWRDRPRFDRPCSMPCAGSAGARPRATAAIARRIGAPRASRAVGGALGRNPISWSSPATG